MQYNNIMVLYRSTIKNLISDTCILSVYHYSGRTCTCSVHIRLYRTSIHVEELHLKLKCVYTCMKHYTSRLTQTQRSSTFLDVVRIRMYISNNSWQSVYCSVYTLTT